MTSQLLTLANGKIQKCFPKLVRPCDCLEENYVLSIVYFGFLITSSFTIPFEFTSYKFQFQCFLPTEDIFSDRYYSENVFWSNNAWGIVHYKTLFLFD